MTEKNTQKNIELQNINNSQPKITILEKRKSSSFADFFEEKEEARENLKT